MMCKCPKSEKCDADLKEKPFKPQKTSSKKTRLLRWTLIVARGCGILFASHSVGDILVHNVNPKSAVQIILLATALAAVGFFIIGMLVRQNRFRHTFEVLAVYWMIAFPILILRTSFATSASLFASDLIGMAAGCGIASLIFRHSRGGEKTVPVLST